MVFLPGDHTLDTNITVANVDRLTMHGESSSGKIATVVCSGPVGLSFTRMVEFKMRSLAFTSCSRLLRYTIIILDHTYTPVYGAMYLQSTQYAELVNCSFHDNNGTALLVDNTDITLAGNTEFTHNRACGNIVLGGAIIAVSSNLTFTGNTTFLGNSAIFGQCPFDGVVGGGGAIYTSDTVLSFSGTNHFMNNSAPDGGVFMAYENTVLTFSGTNNFINNSADSGGVIWTYENTVLSFSGTNNFINNSANYGGVILTYGHENIVLSFSGTNNFINNSAVNGSGGAIHTSDTVLSFSGTNNFINNSAVFGGGGAIYTSDTVLSFSGTNNFINNSAVYGGGGGVISASESTVLSFSGTSNFINNSAFKGGAIFSETNTTLTFSGILYFTNNRYTFGGGGVYLGLKSTISILPNTTVYWENNHAHFGGAIYVADVSTMSYCTLIAKFVPKEECFFQLPGQNLSNGIDVRLVFKNNFAGGAGSMLYGGAIDNCILTGLDSNSSGKVFDMIVHNNDSDDNTTSTISSDPLRICLCENNLPDCDDYKYHFARTVYLGETFHVSVVAVGQRNGSAYDL